MFRVTIVKDTFKLFFNILILYFLGGKKNMKRKSVSIFVFLTLVMTAFAIVPSVNAQGDFGISAYPSSQTVNPGGSATFLVTVTSLDGFNSPVTLSASGLPDEATAFFAPNPIIATGNSMLTISTSPETPTGSFDITITGTGGSLTRYTSAAITIDFGLLPKKFGTYTGQVTDFNTENPIAGAHVFLYGSTDYYFQWPEGYWYPYVVSETYTDENGYYTITGPLGDNNAPYDYVVGFHADDYSETYHIATAVADTITTVNMALRNAIITGKVTDSVTGYPIAGATVFTYCFYHSEITPSGWYLGDGCPIYTTDENGYYTITGVPLLADNAPYKQVEVFWADGYSGTYRLVTAVADTTITENMELCHTSITGEVTDDVTGETIEGVTITAWSIIPPPADYAFYYLSNSYATGFTNNGEGLYTLPNLPLAIDDGLRAYSVKVSAPGYYDKTQTAIISCGEDTILDFSLIPKLFGAYTGQVTDSDTGAGIAGATVFVYSVYPNPSISSYYYINWPEGNPSYYVVPEATTDENGYYTITGVPLDYINAPTDYIVGFHADDYSETYHIATAVADTITTVNMALHNAIITGRVTDANTYDEPIVGATVFAISHYYYGIYPDQRIWWNWYYNWYPATPEVLTDEDGYYTITGVPLGADNTPYDWAVGFHADGYSGTYHMTTIVADTTSIVDMALCHASITGRVIDASTGAPIQGATITAWSTTSNSYADVVYFTTDEQGVYTLPNLVLDNDDEPRLYYVQASASGYYTQTKSGTIFCGGIITIDFGPEVTFGTIKGTVIECITEEPIAGAFIGSTFGGATYTNNEGMYILTNVPLEPDGSPKTWDVTAMADGYGDETQSVEVRANEVSVLDFILCPPFTNQPPVAIVNGPYTGYEGSPIDFSATGSSDPDGDLITYSWDLNGDGIYGDATGATPSYTWYDDYFGVISVEVSDGYFTVTASTTVTVYNVAPDITYLTVSPGVVAVGGTVTLDATFTDPGTLDTHTAMIDWENDGTYDDTMLLVTSPIQKTHSYADAGVYTVKLTVEDDDLGSDTEIFQYVVVYDPSDGFVTGGGWINSPEGAYTPDPTLTGRANFGFVSKYKKGQQNPTGNTEFQFQVADLNFHSDSYDWLVIAGAKAMYKGTGTINGAGNYGFMLSAIDEKLSNAYDVDMFRIRIWDKNNGDAVIYDNNIGNDPYGNPTTAIAGGQIVIHKT
jgi:5-hydroxyisourate hydrolase-like protein (transthyretin family)